MQYLNLSDLEHLLELSKKELKKYNKETTEYFKLECLIKRIQAEKELQSKKCN